MITEGSENGTADAATGIYKSSNLKTKPKDPGSATTDEEQCPGAEYKEMSKVSCINADASLSLVMFTLCMPETVAIGTCETLMSVILFEDCSLASIHAGVHEDVQVIVVACWESSCGGQAPHAYNCAQDTLLTVDKTYMSAFELCAGTVYGKTGEKQSDQTTCDPRYCDTDASARIMTTEIGSDTLNVNMSTADYVD